MADLDLANELVQLARRKSIQVTTAESCTGGLLSAAITSVPGSSYVFSRGHVTYSNQAKIDMLNVNETTLTKRGAVSEEIARQMARGCLDAAQADLAIAITGIAGPGGSGAKPEGRVCFALASRSQPIFSETKEFGAVGRQVVREDSVDHALKLIISHLSRSRPVHPQN